jgi:hypothetical protein
MKKTIFLVIVLLLTACSSSDAAIQTAIAQTQIAIPTNTSVPSETPTQIPTETPAPSVTPTLIPLDKIDLESLAIQEGDLPAGYSESQVRTILPEMFEGIPEPINGLYQQFEHDNEAAGGVSIIIYQAESTADKAYYQMQQGMGDDAKLFSGLGERAHITIINITMLGITMQTVDLLFIHCATIVYIRMSDTINTDYAVAYAERLDKRLSPYICPQLPGGEPSQ